MGGYSSWHEAIEVSKRIGGDYENKNIIDQVVAATQKVRHGEAIYEQDGVCFYEPHNNFQLLTTIFYTKAMLGNISVVDFGGALGSTYFHYRDILSAIETKWCVVEQKHFVDCGKANVPEIDFYYNLDEALASANKPNVLLLSSVLQYLDAPYKWLGDMLCKGFSYVIVDRTAFQYDIKAKDKIVLQNVPASIYKAVYPLHLLGLEEFKCLIGKCGYEVIWEWSEYDDHIPLKKGLTFEETIDRGFLLHMIK